MNEPRWLAKEEVLFLHVRQLELHGGAPGVRDAGLLESAMGRPLNAFAYAEPDLSELAALYCLGIVKNHPFVDGNKRTGFMAMYTFLGLNGHDFEADEVDVVLNVRGIAASELSDEEFIAWVRAHVV